MLAIVETGGKQYEVIEGRYIDIELLDAEKDASVDFEKVVMIMAGDQTKVGQPYVEGAVVKATIVGHGKDKKVIVYKQRCKKGYRKKQGHRQNYTRVMIDTIDFPEKEAVLAAEEKIEAKKAEVKKAAEKKTAAKAEAKKTAKTAAAKKATTAKKETAKSAPVKEEAVKAEPAKEETSAAEEKEAE